MSRGGGNIVTAKSVTGREALLPSRYLHPEFWMQKSTCHRCHMSKSQTAHDISSTLYSFASYVVQNQSKLASRIMFLEMEIAAHNQLLMWHRLDAAAFFSTFASIETNLSTSHAFRYQNDAFNVQNGWNDSCSIGMIPLDSGLSPISASKWAVHYWWFFVLLVLAPWPQQVLLRRCWLKHRRFSQGVESDYTIRHASDPQHPVFRNLVTVGIWSPIVSL